MNSKLHTKFVPIALLATPIICLLLSIVAWAVSSHQPIDDGSDWSKALPYFGVGLGMIGSAIGLVTGTIITSLARKSKNTPYALYGYLSPAGLAILYMVYLIFLNL